MHLLMFPQTDLSVGVLAVLYQSSWYLLKLATRGPPRDPPRACGGKMPRPWQPGFPRQGQGSLPESKETDPLPPLKLGKWTPSGPKPRKRKNESALFGGIGELGLSGWRGSIRLVKLVWLVLPKKLGNGGKGPIYRKRTKNVKNRDFPFSPLRILY